MPDPVAAVIGGGTLIGSKISADATKDAARTAAEAAQPVPFDSPLYQTNVVTDEFGNQRIVSNLTPEARALQQGFLGDFRSIPLSSIASPGFAFGQSSPDLVGRSNQLFDTSSGLLGDARSAFARASDQNLSPFQSRAVTAFDRAADPNLSPFQSRAITAFDRAADQNYSPFQSRAVTAFDRAATPESSLAFLQEAYGPQLEQARLQQENRLLNQGLLGSTAGSLQTEGLSRGQQQALMQGALQQQQFQGQLGGALAGAALNQQQLQGQLGSNLAGAALSERQLEGQLGSNLANAALGQQQLQANIGQGLLSGATNFGQLGLGTRELYSRENIQRAQQDLAQRQLLGNLRQGALGNFMGLLGGGTDAVGLTIGGGSPSAAGQAAAMGAMGQQNLGNNIASAATAFGLNYMGMQPQSVTPIPITRTITPAFNQGVPTTGFSGTTQFGGVGPLSILPQ